MPAPPPPPMRPRPERLPRVWRGAAGVGRQRTDLAARRRAATARAGAGAGEAFRWPEQRRWGSAENRVVPNALSGRARFYGAAPRSGLAAALARAQLPAPLSHR
jgi:hypothetical protein